MPTQVGLVIFYQLLTALPVFSGLPCLCKSFLHGNSRKKRLHERKREVY